MLGWAQEVEERGAGEILLTSIDREGTGKGFDTELVRMVSSIVNIPVIAHGGAGRVSDIIETVSSTDVDAVAISSMLHYAALNRTSFKSSKFDDEGNIEFLKKYKPFKNFGGTNIFEIKNSLKKVMPVRLINYGCSSN